MSEADDYLAYAQQSREATRAAVEAAAGDSPEQAAKAYNAEKDLGFPSGSIYGDDQDEVIDHYKAKAAGDLVANNPRLRNYVDYDKIAASASNDDWGPLDKFTTALNKVYQWGSEFQQWRMTALEKSLKSFSDAYDNESLTDEAKGAYAHINKMVTDPTWRIILKDLLSTGDQRPGDITQDPITMIASVPHLFSGILAGVSSYAGSVAEGTGLRWPYIASVNPDEWYTEPITQERAAREFYHGLTALQGALPPDAIPGSIHPHGWEMLRDNFRAGRAAGEWISAGKNIPTGLNGTIDDAIKAESIVNERNASDALQKAFATASRERTPLLFEQFFHDFPDAKVEVSAEGIRKLYGDEVPTAGDGKLGNIPDLAQKLADAEEHGGAVDIPTRDWFTHVGRDVISALHDDYAIKPGDLTLNEVKELPPAKPTPPERADQVRQVAGADPMLQVVDEGKLVLQKVEELTEEQRSILDRVLGRKGLTYHGYEFLNEHGERVGGGLVSLTPDGKTLTIENISGAGQYGYGPNDFGPKMTMDLLRQLRQEFPNISKLKGYRISGAREEAGVPRGKKRWVEIDLDKSKFDKDGNPKGWDVVEPLHQLLTGGQWETVSKGIDTYVKPYEQWTDVEKSLAQAAMEEMRRIVGDKPFLDYTVTKGLKVNEQQTWGVFQMYREFAPTIIASLESPDVISTMRHEAIHFLRQMGLWRPEEWATLERAARAGNWIKKWNIDRRYPTLDFEGKLEEAIAEEYGHWRNGQKTGTHETLQPIFVKLRDTLARIGKTVKEFLGRDSGFEDLFLAADIGEIGKREIKPLREDVARPGPEGEVIPGKATAAPVEGAAQVPEEPLQGPVEQKKPFLKKMPGMIQQVYNNYLQLIENQRLTEAQRKEARLRELERRRQTVEWKDNRKDMRVEVAARMANRPDIAADRLFREGNLFGAKIGPLPKLRRDEIPEALRPALEKYIADEGGIHPDDLAGVFGYGSGDEMVQRLAQLNEQRKLSGLEPKEFLKKAIDAETDRLMEARYGKLQDNINMAVDDMLSPHTLGYLHEETVHLASLSPGQAIPLDPKVMEQRARASVARLSLGQIKSEKFLRFSKKAADRAELAATKGDWLTAFKFAQQREYALIKAKEARLYEDEVEDFKATAKTNARRSRDALPGEYSNFAHDILRKVGMKIQRTDQDLIREIKAGDYDNLQDFVDQKRADGWIIEMPSFLYTSTYGGRTFESLTGEEFRNMHEGLDSLLTTGRLEKKMELERGEFDLDQAKHDSIELMRYLKKVDLTGPTAGLRKVGRNVLAGHLQIETMVARLERGNYGPLTQTIRELIDAANQKEKAERIIAGQLRKLGKIEKPNRKIENTIFREPKTRPGDPPGDLIPMRRKNLISIMLNVGSNLKQMAIQHGVEPADIMNWINQYATKKDWDYVQGVGKIFGGLKEESNAMYRRLSGLAPADLELTPVKTNFGEIPGWYYPLIPHEIWEKTRKSDLVGKLGQGYVTSTVPRGYTLTRTGAIYPLSMDLDAMIPRLGQEINDIYMREAWLNASKLLGSSEIKNEISKRMGPEFSKLIDPYLRDVAGIVSYRSELAKSGAIFSEFFRQNLISSLVGFNINTVLKHGSTAFVQSVYEAGAVDFAREFLGLFSRNAASGELEYKFARSKSAELQRRMRNYLERIPGVTAEALGKMSLREMVQWLGSQPVAIADLMSAVPTWLAVYKKEMRLNPNDEGAAISKADYAVRRAHGSTGIASRAAFARQGAGAAWFTSLYGFFNHILQRQYEMVWRAKEAAGLVKAGEYAAGLKEFKTASGLFISYVIAPGLIDWAFSGDEIDEDESYTSIAAKMLVSPVFGTWVGARDLASAWEHGKDPSFGLFGTAGMDLVSMGRDLMKDEPFNEEHMGRLIRDGSLLIGLVTGFPGGQVGKAAQYYTNVLSGQEEPEGFMDWQYGIRFGHGRKQK